MKTSNNLFLFIVLIVIFPFAYSAVTTMFFREHLEFMNQLNYGIIIGILLLILFKKN